MSRAARLARPRRFRSRPRRPLRPIEIMEGVILGDVSVALCVVGRFLPGGGVLRVVAVVPFAAVAARHRLRAVVAAAIAASAVAFLVAGGGIVVSVLGCGVLGWLVGVAFRRSWGAARTLAAATLLLWPPLAIATVAVLLVFSDLRRLTLAGVRNSWLGASRLLRDAGLDRVSSIGDDIVHFVIHWWWIFLPLVVLVGVLAATSIARLIATPVLRRLEVAAPARPLDTPGESDRGDGPPGPVPATLHDVSYSFPNATTAALQHVSMTVRADELLAVVGRNGSGKSTLIRLLAGRTPTSGEITRPGLVALGGISGTGLIFQRPEAQVLGVRVRDDVVWGLPPGSAIDVRAALDHVGLGAFADRETATLSGGELQRLAIAAALVRRPALLLSDESTAMVDHAGRDAMMQLFSTLAVREHLAVAHVTHDRTEAARAGRVVAMADGTIVAESMPALAQPDTVAVRLGRPRPAVARRDELLSLVDVGHVYSRGSPWAHRALHGINLSVHTGEGVLVVGSNGSGKSTLAWILAGLVLPNEGHARLEGRPVHRQVGRVALSLQHARLQLLRPTVGDDIASAAGPDALAVSEALELVGLDPSFRDRRIDELSGGEQRRVAIAGLLAHQPRLLVLDEPFAGLDEEARALLAGVLDRLRAEGRTTLVVVSHDLVPAIDIVDRVVRLEAGTLIADARADRYRSPATGEVDRAR